MSRTDHHAPLWVQATTWEPWHHRCLNDARWRPDGRPCTLPGDPVVEHPSTHRGARRTGCEWIPVDDRHGYSVYFSPVPRWYVRHVYHSRERTQARADRQRLLAEHRATGRVDHIPQPRQARHSAQWLYW
jgi:hypothetical protein